MNPTDHSRRRLLLAAAAASALPGVSWAQGQTALRIGYQKSSTLMILLKSRQTLEKALAPKGVAVQWYEFTSGLPLLEALNLGNIDLSADVADAVPPFALAAGAALTYYASETLRRRRRPLSCVATRRFVRWRNSRGSGWRLPKAQARTTWCWKRWRARVCRSAILNRHT